MRHDFADDEIAASKPRPSLSAVVITYNREKIIGTCLKALGFACEILVVDKSSTDATRSIAARYADRVIQVPWSPTVEETRGFAVSQCSHDWVLLLDDDECLNAQMVLFIDRELRSPRANIYSFPLRHYIMATHDERAYYWPASHVRLFRRGSIAFRSTVHGGMEYLSEQLYHVPVETGVCIHHLSHVDAAQWVEKANRYTSQPDRKVAAGECDNIIDYAHGRIDHWAGRCKTREDPYVSSMAVLRALYDIIDHVKAWEQSRGRDGEALFSDICAGLEEEYRTVLGHLVRPHAVA